MSKSAMSIIRSISATWWIVLIAATAYASWAVYSQVKARALLSYRAKGVFASEHSTAMSVDDTLTPPWGECRTLSPRRGLVGRRKNAKGWPKRKSGAHHHRSGGTGRATG